VPTCSGEYKQQLVAFLDRFKLDAAAAGPQPAAAATAAAAKASASVGSNLGSLAEDDPANESAEDAGVPEAATAGRL
jgi:hypothetical protein